MCMCMDVFIITIKIKLIDTHIDPTSKQKYKYLSYLNDYTILFHTHFHIYLQNVVY